MRNREASVEGELFREHRGGDFVKACSAILLGDAAAEKTELAGFFHQRRHQAGLLVFEVFDEGQNFFHDEFFGGLADELLIVAEIGGGEELSASPRFLVKNPALSRGVWLCFPRPPLPLFLFSLILH